MSRAMLGLWEEAARDLRVASNLDYDEEVGMSLKKVEPNARKIEEHRRKYERLRKQKGQKKSQPKKQQQAEAQDQEALSALKDGQVISIHSGGELETKLGAASKTSRLAILYFTATRCGPCRFISPIYTSLAEKYPKVVFLKVDIDEARDVAARWNISSVPSFFFVKNGKEVDSAVGADKSTLERKIIQHAGSL
uniref:Thioredoxin domain-containing protein n=1 Tax=Lotus japonicus TaxID=34305 RepID=I3S894_LOTJA|nr:unknown [Lotus japonicus]